MYGVSETKTFDSGKESVIIRNYVNGIMGGVILDMTGFSGEFIQCGHIIIRDTKSGEYKPMPVTGEAYASLPENQDRKSTRLNSSHRSLSRMPSSA